MLNLFSWLRTGGPSNGTASTTSKSQPNEVIDISNDNDDSEDELAVGPPSKPSSKRKIVDISRSDVEDMAPKRPRGLPRSNVKTTKTVVSHETRPDGIQRWLRTDVTSKDRTVFRELDADQFQNRLRGPIGWCSRPVYSKPFKSQFAPSKVTRSSSTARSVGLKSAAQKSTRAKPSRAISDSAAVEQEVDVLAKVLPAVQRARRTNGRQSYAALFDMEEESDDELTAHAHRRKRNSKKSRMDESGSSDFEMRDESEDSVIGSDSIDMNSAEDSPMNTDETESERELKGKRKPTKTKSTTNVNNRTAPIVKGRAKTAAKSSKKVKSLTTRPKEWGNGIVESLPPMSDVSDIFDDLTKRGLELGLEDAIKHLHSTPVRIATVCSGTESPLLALEMVRDSLKSSGRLSIEVEHAFSAEIVPFKQAYIERNFHPPIIFADVTEFVEALEQEERVATTAYGAKVRIPGGVQILIAGTPCVDYSPLNNLKKGIDDGGESGEVWNAVRAYAVVERPAIIIFENVRDAPWDRMLEDYEKIGYDCAAVRVDTKDFYVPQTRQRGYMVCFDRAKLEANSLEGVSAAWTTRLGKFKRPASSPVSAFLLPNDAVSRQHYRADEPRTERAWAACKITQEQTRQEERLGTARPITGWSESGALRPPEHSQQAFHRSTVDRVNDTIDCNYLRKLRSSYDNRYKDRVYNVSQNVYMEHDSTAFGIVGCLTPSGMFYSTLRARLFAPQEMLTLQGLPIDKMSFTTETHSNIQDLAGNAMSSMVMGAAILSALIVGHKAIAQDGDLRMAHAMVARSGQAIAEPDKIETVAYDHARSAIDMAALLCRAEQAMRRCFCEGKTGMAEKPIQQCVDCGHTTCTGCGGNPAHQYRHRPLISNGRISPRLFEDELKAILPMRLELDGEYDLSVLLSGTSDDYRHAARAALDAKFAFQRIIRTHCWTVTFVADDATLELVLCDPARAEWRLYAHTAKSLPANDSLRKLLQQPIAKASAVENFFGNSWTLRSPVRESVSLSITGSGTKIASLWNRVKLPDYTEHFLWEYLSLQMDDKDHADIAQQLNGTYRHLHLCGTACDSLYIRQLPEGSPPTYLFLDPTPTGDPEKDCFVFSHDIERLDYGIVRQVIARLPPSWRAFSTGSRTGIPAVTHTDLLIDDHWLPLPHQLRESKIQLELKRPMYLEQSTACREAQLMLSCVLSTEVADTFPQLDGKLTQKREFEQSTWIMELMARNLDVAQWSPLPLRTSNVQCNTCAPSPPRKLWGLNDRGDILPLEDPVSAGIYERAIKTRPDPLFVTATRKDSNMHLELAININTLAHRACARLAKTDGLDGSVRLEWRFTASAEQPFVFKPFRLRHTEELSRASLKYDMNVTLFPNQVRMLNWMHRQEAGASFELQEVSEATLSAIGWRAEVRARGSIQVKGGICADHPGFGKTITSLALIDSHLREAGKGTIVQQLDKRLSPGLISTAASLIVCPSSLVGQWCDEIRLKLRNPGKVLKVVKTSDLSKFTIQDFVEATIIVLSRNVLVSESYVDRLAASAAIPGPATSKSRAYEEWLRSAKDRLRAHVDLLRRKGAPSLRRHLQEKYHEAIASDQYTMHIPSKRLRGAAYVAAKEKGKNKVSTAKTTASAKLDTAHVGSPLFEMFYFNRMLVDEFHQLDSRERLAIYTLHADKRWGLSATPDLGDFQDSAQVASLLGVKLPIGGDGRSVMKSSNARKLAEQMTPSERFHAFRETPSETQHARIYELHQKFLSTFVRRNVMDFDKALTYEEHLVPVKLDGVHQGLYMELFQHTKAQGMRLTKSSQRTSRQSRFGSVIDADDGPEQALSKAASNIAGGIEFDVLCEEAQRRIASLSAQLPKAIVHARKIEPENFKHWVVWLQNGMLGDAAVTKTVITMVDSKKPPESLDDASGSDTENFPKLGGDDDEPASDTEKPKKGRGAGKRVMIARLNELCNDLVDDWRSARYLSNVQETLAGDYSSGPKGGTFCDAAQCTGVGSNPVALSPVCGHVVCQQCEQRFHGTAGTSCSAPGCAADMSEVVLLRASRPVDETTKPKDCSAKVQAVMDVLTQVQESKEQAILFVQYESEVQLMAESLKDCDITAIVVRNSSAASTYAEEFRDSAGTPSQTTVLVLNASSDTAAGLNLQNANHILFLSPLLRETQYEYDATMAQAIGRARRYGQTKQIHVYRFVALNTIDVDVLEHREKRVDALLEQGAPALAPPPRLSILNMRPERRRERTQLVCEHGRFSLRPQSWLEACANESDESAEFAHGRKRILGYEDYSSGLHFGRNFTEDDED